MHQERRFPARVIGTTLVNPDFCDLARSFGIEAEAVTQTDQFEGALGRAMERNHASLIEVVIDAEAVAPELTLSGLRHR
jgi:acetolactate synthase I/II/III large subunit